MKKLFLLGMVMLGAMTVRSQGFEGTIRWTMNMEITDAKAKAEMERAQQKMNDPAMQQQMKEMEKQMQDPQFKAMMEANPQMKAQMENTMKMMKGGSMGMGNMMPKGMTIHVKGMNSITKMEGGSVDGLEVLTLNGKSYEIDRNNKTYRPIVHGEGMEKMGEVKVTKTSETGKVLNYNCTKYIAEFVENGQTMTQYIWASTEVKDIDYKAFAKQSMNRGGRSMFYEQVEGLPLKTVMNMPQGNMTMQVTEIKREPIAADAVALPAGFTEVK